jgi:hypothetical protein
MSRKQRPRDSAKRRKAEWHKLMEKASGLLSQERVPRDPTEALAWLKQFASELLDVQEKMHEAFRPVAEAVRRDHRRRSRMIGAQWIEPPIVSPHLLKWFTDAVKACDSEEPMKGKRLDVALGRALGLIRPRGRPRDTQDIAIRIDDLKREGASLYEIADRLDIDFRTVQRISNANPDAVIKHRISLGPSVPRGYDLKDGKPIVNEREAAIVRMLFERYARLDSAPAPKRALAALMRKLRAEGITDERGKPIDKAYLYNVLNNRVYIGEAVHKNMSGKYEAIVDRALWLKVHRISRVLTAVRRRKGAQKATLNTRI